MSSANSFKMFKPWLFVFPEEMKEDFGSSSIIDGRCMQINLWKTLTSNAKCNTFNLINAMLFTVSYKLFGILDGLTKQWTPFFSTTLCMHISWKKRFANRTVNLSQAGSQINDRFPTTSKCYKFCIFYNKFFYDYIMYKTPWSI